MLKPLLFAALSLALAGPLSAQAEASEAPAQASTENVVAAVRDCIAATSPDEVSNEILFGQGWKIGRPLNEDRQLERPDLTLPLRAYFKGGGHPVVIVDQRKPETADACNVTGNFAEGVDYDRLIVALTKAFGAPAISKAEGPRAFKFGAHAIFATPVDPETGRQFRILISELGE